MLCGRAAIRCRRRRIQIGLKQYPRARGVSKNHRIDVLRERNRIKLKRLTALADDLLPLINFDCAGWLRRLAIASFVEFVLGMGMPRLQKGTKNRLISFLYEYRCAHCCGRANASDMVIVVMRNRNNLYRLCWKLFLNRAEQHVGLRLCVRRTTSASHCGNSTISVWWE